MKEKSHIKISLEKDGWKREVKSLCWCGDYLIDYIGLNVYHLSGEILDKNISYAYRFDRAISTPDGKYAVLYETYGTKGIILKENKLLREINRSFYLADAYEYPVTVFRSLDNRLCLAHCPEDYNVLDIDDLETGERLTSANRESNDFFQSRLQASPDGRYILSAGWVWHPVDSIEIFDLEDDISNPKNLSPYRNEALQDLRLFEINAAVFIDNSTIVLTGSDEDFDEVKYIYLFDVENSTILSKAKLPEIAGTLMGINKEFAIGFYENPKLINLKTGEIVYKWMDIFSGTQNSSINLQNELSPPIVFDEANKRFAVADSDFIHVITLEL